MALVKSKNSRPELLVRSAVHRLGYRFRLHQRDLPGTPDIVIRKNRQAIFVHGCFWHRHPGCVRTTTPKTRSLYWKDKFARNVERDRTAITNLKQLGWRILVVWECETFDPEKLTRKLITFLAKESP
ncbi:DNA mismatch endonuclease Vsr [Bradyrhizobium diazoefficiens]|nr:DNA mismatch endonuclease Vsr [Bradyrhizobium diazoefficiens]